MGLLDYRTTKFENDANRPSCFQQLQAVIYIYAVFFSGSAIVQYPLIVKIIFAQGQKLIFRRFLIKGKKTGP